MASFESLGIRAEILLALNDLGFTKPTPVQAATIPVLLADEADMVAWHAPARARPPLSASPCWSVWTPR
jgi:superfamily II DNA/RNA helicase